MERWCDARGTIVFSYRHRHPILHVDKLSLLAREKLRKFLIFSFIRSAYDYTSTVLSSEVGTRQKGSKMTFVLEARGPSPYEHTEALRSLNRL